MKVYMVNHLRTYIIALLCIAGTMNVWAEITTVYDRGTAAPHTIWSATDLDDWTVNAAGTSFAIESGLKAVGGNASYEYQKTVNYNSTAKLTITADWNTGSSIGRVGGYNYLSFGNIELRAYGQDPRGTIVINGVETTLTNGVKSAVRDNAVWHISLTITQGKGELSYSITIPGDVGTVGGTENIGTFDLTAIKMGYMKVGRITSTNQTLQNIKITQELYQYTVSATSSGSLSQTIATGLVGPYTTVTVPYQHHLLSGTTLHMANPQGTDPHYGYTLLVDKDNKAATINYEEHTTNVSAFREAEEFMTPIVGNSYIANRTSGMQGAKSAEYVTALNLPGGVYQLSAASYARTGYTFYFKVGESVVFNHVGNGMWGSSTSGNIVVPPGTPVQVIGGNDSYALDYVYAKAVLAFKEPSSTLTIGNTSTPQLLTEETGITYSIVGGNKIASVSSTGEVTPHHNGTVVLRAYKEIAGIGGCYAYHTITITGETAATTTWAPATSIEDAPETFTITGNGYVNESYTSYSTRITIEMGADSVTQISETIVGKAASYSIDGAGRTFATLDATGTATIPVTGSYYVFKPKVNGLLSIHALLDAENGLRLVDENGKLLEKKTIAAGDVNTWQNFTFSSPLTKNKTYYVYAETKNMVGAANGSTSATLYLNAFTFTPENGTIINFIDQSLLFKPGATGASLNRTIPRYDIAFSGDEGVQYTVGGVFKLTNAQDGSEDKNGTITITPRTDIAAVKIKTLKMNIGAVSGSPEISVNEESPVAVSANSTLTFSSLTKQTLTLKLKGTGDANSISININSITVVCDPEDATLNEEKQPVTMSFELPFVYGYDEESIENNCNIESPLAFNGEVKYHLVNMGEGVLKKIATTEETNYFAAGHAETRLYTRDYVEERDDENRLTLAANETYTVPAADGLTFRLTTSGGTIGLSGTKLTEAKFELTEGELFTDTAKASSVTITNKGTGPIVINRIEVFRKSAQLNFSYKEAGGGDGNILLNGEKYTPATFSVVSDDSSIDILSKYDKTSGRYAITKPLNGVTIDSKTGLLTVSSEADEGEVEVTMTLQPKEASRADYSPLQKTITLLVTSGMWDFRSYSQQDHWRMYNSMGWNGNETGWYAARNNATFEYVLRNDGTMLPVAFGLQTRGRHRLLHSNHGYLHLQGKGNGSNETPNGGGEVRVPVKKGMLVEINAYSEAYYSEMQLIGLSNLDGSAINAYYVNENAETQQFLATTNDGYFTIKNPSSNLQLHICYIRVSGDMVFRYGNETYVEYVSAGTRSFTNDVINKGTNTITYSFKNKTNAPVTDYTTTGTFTIGSGVYGSFEVTAVGSGEGMLDGKQATYMAHVVGMTATNLSQNIAPATTSYSFNLKDALTITGISGTTDNTLKDYVVFTTDEKSPTINLTGSTLTMKGAGQVTVKATLGLIEKTFTCTVNGGSLDVANPVIPNTTKSYTVTLQGSELGKSTAAPFSSTYFFNVERMKTDAMGDLQPVIDTDFTFTETSNKLTIEYTGSAEKVPGGVIPIYATYTRGGNTYTVEGTLTIAYSSHVWDFQSNLVPTLRNWEPRTGTYAEYVAAHNTPTIDEPTDGGAGSSANHWRMIRKIGGHRDVSMIYYYNHPSTGNNALIIPQTEGLAITSTEAEQQLGVEMLTGANSGGVKPVRLVDSDSDGTEDDYYCSNLMLRLGAKLTIPQLKPGQWIEMRWTRHQNDMGERLLMENLSDVEGKLITEIYKIGNCFYDLGANSTSTYMLQVNPALSDGYYNATFTIADNIYISIQKIILHEPGWSYESSMTEQLKGFVDLNGAADEATLEKTKSGWTQSSAPNVNWQYLFTDGNPHTITFLPKQLQNAPNAPQQWKFTKDDTFTDAQLHFEEGMLNEPQLTYEEGWGKVRVELTSYTQDQKYVANRKQWVITFGKAPAQSYPYTWDFTKYFKNTHDNIGTDTWTAVSNLEHVNYTSYNSNNYSSYFVEGAQLVSYALQEPLPETDGLGFKLNTNTDNIPDASLTLNMTNGNVAAAGAGVSSAQTWREGGYMKISEGGTIIVPKPGDDYANFYIYLKSSAKPSAVSNCTEVTSDYATEYSLNYDVGTNQYRYRFNNNADAEITFSADAEVYMIGVTNQFKQLNKFSTAAWATESRSIAIDHTLTGFLTTNPTQVYAIIQKSGNPLYTASKNKTTVRIEDRRYVIPANTGIVMKQTDDVPDDVPEATNYEVPLFTPAVTTQPDNEFENNLMRPNVVERTFSSETENLDGTAGEDYTIFILTNRYVTWRKGDGEVSSDDAFRKTSAPAFYRMHIYDETFDGKSAATLNTLGANKAYLLLKSNQINGPLWQNAAARQYAGIEGVSDWDEETINETVNRVGEHTHTFYNLNGQAVGNTLPTAPGIYISNGKKLVVHE